MPELFRNNAESTLAAAIDGEATELQLPAGHAARFPFIDVPDGGETTFIRITVEEGETREIMACVDVDLDTDTLTIERGSLFEEGNTANQSFGVGAKVSHRLTQGAILDMRALTYAVEEQVLDVQNVVSHVLFLSNKVI